MRIDIVNWQDKLVDYGQFTVVSEAIKHYDRSNFTWINIQAAEKDDILEILSEISDRIAGVFNSIVHNSNIIDEFEELFVFSLNDIRITSDSKPFEDNLFFILSDKLVISIVFGDEFYFDQFRKRLINRNHKSIKRNSSYLFLTLLRESVINNYFENSNMLWETLEKYEKILISERSTDLYEDLTTLRSRIKRTVLKIYSLKSIDDFILTSESLLLQDESLTNIKSHVSQGISDLKDIYSSLHEWINELIELHKANVSSNLEKRMRILTVVSTIFLPITFLAGVYGMNFEFMPELKIHGAYYILLLIMLLIIISMLFYMKRRKWFS